jgi:hypothetical protein
MGKPVETIKQLVEESKIGAVEVTKAFNLLVSENNGLSVSFFGMQKRQSRSTEGLWSTLKDNLQIMLKNMGLTFIKAFGLKDLLDEFNNAVNGMETDSGRLERIFGGLRKIFDAFRAAAMGVGKVLFNMLAGGEEGLNWDKVEETALNVFEAIIRGVGRVLEFLKTMAVFIIDNIIVPLAKAADDLGITDNKDKPSGFYSQARARGNSRGTALLAMAGGNTIDLGIDLFSLGTAENLSEYNRRTGKTSGGAGAAAVADISQGIKNMRNMNDAAAEAAAGMRDFHKGIKADRDRVREPFAAEQQDVVRGMIRQNAQVMVGMTKNLEVSGPIPGVHGLAEVPRRPLGSQDAAGCEDGYCRGSGHHQPVFSADYVLAGRGSSSHVCCQGCRGRTETDHERRTGPAQENERGRLGPRRHRGLDDSAQRPIR